MVQIGDKFHAKVDRGVIKVEIVAVKGFAKIPAGFMGSPRIAVCEGIIKLSDGTTGDFPLEFRSTQETESGFIFTQEQEEIEFKKD